MKNELAAPTITLQDGVMTLNMRSMACGLALLAVLFTNISASANTICYLLAILCAVPAVGYKRIYVFLGRYQFLLPLLMLAVLLFFGVFRNHYNSARAWHQFFKYIGKWLALIALLPVFSQDKYRNFFYNGLVLGIFLTSLMVYVAYPHVPFLYNGMFMYLHMVDAIPWSFMLGFTAYILANQIVCNTKFRVLRSLLLLWFLYALFFLNIERSGMLVGILLAAVISFQYLPWRKSLLACVMILFGAIILYFVSSAFHTKFSEIISSIISFNKGTIAGSINERLYMAQHSFMLIKQRPWFGFGTGSFPFAYHTTGATIMTGSPIAGGLPNVLYLGDPHNSFLHLWVQLGLVGVICFVAFLVLQFVESFKLAAFERNLAQGLVLSFALMCCCEASFARQGSATYYLIVLAVIFGAYLKDNCYKQKT
jgi:O-antigen ligase